ncbi:MAG TPA: agmatinase [Acidobacteriota bacterium]|nr:agmatinase [Acidobacteriota bacterium]
MSSPIEYNSLPFNYLGIPEEYSRFDRSKVVILPVPYESTTSYQAGTRDAPHEIIWASRNVELYDEELGKETYRIGIHTLDEMIPVLGNADAMVEELYKVSRQIVQAGKFQVTLGGEHAITSPLVRAHLERWPSMAVLQIDAHADLRDSFEGCKHSHASALRRVVEMCPVVHVGIRNISLEEVQALPKLRSKIFYMKDIEKDPDWFVRVVDELPEHVYFTIDIDGMDSSLMPSTGTPEPGGLTWGNLMDLTRELTHRRNVVGMDLVELCPQAGVKAPNFLCAKLIYKILGHVFK